MPMIMATELPQPRQERLKGEDKTESRSLASNVEHTEATFLKWSRMLRRTGCRPSPPSPPSGPFHNGTKCVSCIL